ncbi:NAD(P)-binding protein [Vararia minispora EC-137]|uniref:NAD(P)-binding protein n=1 Tax=Vararia minispora EC-137 TaxID=1314806 RepID=A0ACB8Q7W8_9AGAM|nr:NAD(P)-binding protein [Vararia minispora EC-137]
MGGWFSIISQAYPPKARWSVDDIPDLRGKVAIVTGGNSGCGFETCKQLLRHGAKVYMAARDENRAREAISVLRMKTGREPIFLPLNLTNMASVREAAEAFLAQEEELHILFNNAGIMRCPIEWVTDDGFDMQFGCNVLGHHFFTQLLLPALLNATEESGEKARVITTASSAAYMGRINFDTFVDGRQRRRQRTELLYCQSKLGNIIVSREFARRYGHKLVSTSLNPGNIDTGLYRHFYWLASAFLSVTLNRQPQSMGALTQLYTGTAPETASANGKFFIPWAREGTPPRLANDPIIAERLWSWLEAQSEKF